MESVDQVIVCLRLCKPTIQNLLPRNVLIAILNAYCFDNQVVTFVDDFLTSLKRTKIPDTYNSCQEILSVVPRGSILGPWLFDIDVCDLLFIIEDCDMANYADDNTPSLSV